MNSIKVILFKDLKLDFRSMENFFSMLFFSLIILLVFAFALPANTDNSIVYAPGVFWVTFLLSGILSLSKTFQLEKDNASLDFLLATPISRGAIFLGKMGGNLIFILVIQLIIIPIFCLLFLNSAIEYFPQLFLLSFLVAIGFSALGTLLSGMTVDIRFKEILLPILLFPLLVPLLLSAVRLTQNVLANTSILAQADWLKLLLGFDGIFLVLAYITFDFVMEL